MKKISLFLLATMLLSLFSCKKEETKPNDTDKTNPTGLTESSWKVGSKTFTATFCVGEEANVFSSPMYRLIGISGTEAGVGPNGENLTDAIFVYFKSKPVADGEYEIVLMEDTNDFSTLKNGETCVLTSEKTAYHSISTSEGKKAKVKMVNGKIKITIPAIKSKYGKENLIDDLTETTTVEAILKEN